LVEANVSEKGDVSIFRAEAGALQMDKTRFSETLASTNKVECELTRKNVIRIVTAVEIL
jgi:hypothetical protein